MIAQTRSHSVVVREPVEAPEPVIVATASSSQTTTVEESTTSVVTSNASPHKRVRLSPVSKTVPLPALQAEPTLVAVFELETREATLVEFDDVFGQ